VAAANAPGALNCVTSLLGLNSTGSSNDSTFTFLWSTPNGHFAGPVNGPAATVDSAGLYVLTLSNGQNGCTATDSVSVVVDTIRPLAVAAADAPGVLNCNTSLLGSSDDSGITFLWTSSGGHFAGPVDGPTATVDSAGLYVLTLVNGQNGCTATDTVLVVQHAEVGILPDFQNNPLCFGGDNGSISVFATGGNGSYTYAWSNDADTPVAGNLSAGTHTLTVTDGEGCSATAEFILTQPAELLPQAVATAPGATGAEDGTASANPSGGTGPYTFLWSTGDVTPIIDSLAAGFYTVTVTDANACTAEQTVEVWAGDCNISAVIAAVQPACAGLANGQATVTAAGGIPPYTYSWDSGGSEPQETGLPSGTHTVTVTDLNGCAVSESVLLTDPPALLLEVVEVTATDCPGSSQGSATVAGSGGTGAIGITWSNGQSGATASGLSDGIYTATVTDENGCTATGTVTIDAIDVEVPVIQAGASTLFLGPSGSVAPTLTNLGVTVSDNCALASVQTIPDEFDCTDLGVQQVTLIASDVSGNSSTLTIPVTIADNIAPVLECPPAISRCFGDNVVEYLAPVATDNCLSLGGEFALVEGLPSGLVFPVGATTITYTFTDVQGNTGSCSFEVVIHSPLSIVQDTIIQDIDNQQSGAVLVSVGGSQPGYTYLWTSNGQPVATTEDLSGVGAGEYTLLVTDSEGCTAQAGPFEVSNLSATDHPDWIGRVGVFPNPTTGQLFLQFPAALNNVDMEIAVFDATGRRVVAQHIAGQSLVTLDLAALADGFYALSLRAEGQSGMWKIAVLR
jgi:hypothetical protein